MISIVTPSIGNIDNLRHLSQSLNQQKFMDFELLLCTTGAPAELDTLLPKVSFKIRQLDSPEQCISHARNLGIQNAQGDLILFLDEDCQLPDSKYLKDLYQAYLKNPQFCGGGFYISQKHQLNFTSRFYNFFCNFWIHSHFTKENSPQVLLGGCSFYAKKVLQDHNLRFSALYRKSGEEYEFNRRLIAEGYTLSLHSRWSVYHNPKCHLGALVKKAWLQGKSLDQNKLTPALRTGRFLNFLVRRPVESLKALPLLFLYFLVGRTAHWVHRSVRIRRSPEPLQNTDHKTHAISQMGGYKITKQK